MIIGKLGPHGGPLHRSVCACPCRVVVLLRADYKLQCSSNPAYPASSREMAVFRDCMKSVVNDDQERHSG